MPSKTNPKSAAAAALNREADSNAFINEYLADWDNDDPFASDTPEPASAPQKADNKGKKTDSLGIDEQIDLTRKPRAPRVKLDETRLLSEKGIPKLRKMAPRIKFKGKGHEFSDASRLLSFYQEWLDNLFPKATFLDALAMVEKAGHKIVMRNERQRWIDEGKPKPTIEDVDEDHQDQRSSAPRQPSRIAPIFEQMAGQDRAGTPAADDLFGDDDIYNATPRGSTGPSRQAAQEVPDDDDLDALMAEAESNTLQPPKGPSTTTPSFGSIFGSGSNNRSAQASSGEPDDDDLDALMAEAETSTATSKPSQFAAKGSIFGSRNTAQKATQDRNADEEHDNDLDALMAEAEAEAQAAPSASGNRVTPADGNGNIARMDKAKNPGGTTDQDNADDLDALMAEAEAQALSTTNTTAPPKDSNQRPQTFDDDEEAMAEMDGLW
ncbi:replication fork protection component Swi3-domain-containing protein [Lasiosphaeria miniovina]|uniref:Chromosome segregation in meiosis protein n=1 Tax=Lasiosphaeria miniovina TaxID=1954250 RepID=A0AA40AK28_9PEZI|nr:replication fork protection component Swi3-domain-containing protein [Lasiosphaeria miniovina]KAK0717324.1 replication fork protection component Swi3-domain-containing protein [Lasiosphaeria miniovina]